MVKAKPASVAMRFFMFSALVCSPSLSAQEALPLRALSPEELSVIASGKAVIRTNPNPRGLALLAPGEFPDRIRARVAGIKPNDITELVALSDSSQDGKGMERLAAALADVQSYVGIPYYSKRNKVTVDLFDKVARSPPVALSHGGTIPGGRAYGTLRRFRRDSGVQAVAGGGRKGR